MSSKFLKKQVNTNEFLINVRNINKYYQKKHILKDVSLQVKKGDRIAFIGGNGSGKSTTAEIIAGIRSADNGTIEYAKSAKIGIQFQESNYPFGVSVQILISFYLNHYNAQITKERLNEMLEVFRLKNLLKKQLYEMSGGQKQRLNILLALIHSPNVLILDELSTGLDIKIRRELRDYIIDYLQKNKDVALILITHSMAEVEALTNRVVILDWGKITLDQSVEDVCKKYGSVSKMADHFFDKMYQKEKIANESND